ncbi:MAG TPA: universal stress protein [Sphingobacteriaceae bacterium]
MAQNFKNILIPLNFSESSESAVMTGIAMCKRHQTALHLLYVKEDHNLLVPPGRNPGLFEMTMAAGVALQDELETQARSIETEHGIDCYFHTSDEDFLTAVLETTADFHCGLIVLQKTKGSGILPVARRNSVYRILKNVDCPVLTIPPEMKVLTFSNVLFPVRPLVAALDKLEIALSIITKNNSKVLLFSALDTKNETSDADLVNELTNRAYFKMSINDIDIEKETNVSDNVAREVINKAVERKSDLIIISATIKRGLTARFYRNYTEKVIDSSPIPVLCVRVQPAWS